MISSICNTIFDQSIIDYHQIDDINTPINNTYLKHSIEHLLYHKNWVDAVQWHLEDIVRNPTIDPVQGLSIKQKIDASNQERTDLVERIDNYFLDKYKSITPKSTATINTESPAWAIDRLSILALKIYHMELETKRSSTTDKHKQTAKDKLDILLEQRKDLSNSIDDLLNDIANGNKYMKVYRQMKMYNDPNLNPVLYQQSS
jgi:hypothetical protein